MYLQSMIMVSVSLSLASWKGGCPHTSMKRITPRLHMSTNERQHLNLENLENQEHQDEEREANKYFVLKVKIYKTDCKTSTEQRGQSD